MLNLVKKYKDTLSKQRSFFLRSLSKTLEKNCSEELYPTVFSTKGTLLKNKKARRMDIALSRSYAVWSVEENEDLLLSIKKRVPLVAIAKKHKRSPGAIQAQAKKSFNIFI